MKLKNHLTAITHVMPGLRAGREVWSGPALAIANRSGSLIDRVIA